MVQLLEIQKTKILSRLKDKLGFLFPAAVKNLSVPAVINLVSNIDNLLAEPDLHLETVDISAAASWLKLESVTMGKRWTLLGINKPATTANSSMRISGNGKSFKLMGEQTARHEATNMRLPMKEGWQIQVLTTGDGGDNAREFAFFYEEEDSY